VPFKAIESQFEGAFRDLTVGRPFIIANLWHGRAMRALSLRGDTADGVVNLQTAAENTAYDLLGSLLVDEGATSTEIEGQLGTEQAYRSLMTHQFSGRLGGNWDLTASDPVGTYWSKLYLLRNRVVHAGYTPSVHEAEEAHLAFVAFREFLSQRLWERRKIYPRTLLAKVGTNGLARRGWMTAKMRLLCEQLNSEPYPFYWPRDLANR
jgi:hypothetical protein